MTGGRALWYDGGMVTVSVPQGDSDEQYILPTCAPLILAQLQRVAPLIEQAHRDGHGALKLVINLKGKTGRTEVTSFFD